MYTYAFIFRKCLQDQAISKQIRTGGFYPGNHNKADEKEQPEPCMVRPCH